MPHLRARHGRAARRPGALPSDGSPLQLTIRLKPIPRLVPILLLIGLLLAVAVAIVVVGSPRRLPPPFGLAAPGSVAFVADGHLWTANPDGSGRVQLTSDPRIDGFPTFSRDGTKIAFKRLPVPNSIPNWQDWGDVMVADADGGHPIVLDANVHSPSPITWSPDGRFIVYSRTVGNVDQVSSPRSTARCGGRSRGDTVELGPDPVARRSNDRVHPDRRGRLAVRRAVRHPDRRHG